ncbi:hypothetical protein AC578_10106 [Pseudocercospora eumusae]|uniref:Uncharacterized protein n=1 Tax=Pseudocercospora eumusae TaxID=321146 RepID=A0A139GZM7_9PEZI|nr:hypothetical protein AC578_10106 [Pseudocercospora eumusae]
MKFEIAALLLAAGPLVQAIAVAEPMANAEPKKRLGAWTFCGVPGAACKRDADADAKKRLGAWTFCGVPGAACHRLKRSADAIAEAFADADPEAKKRLGAWTFCGVPGAACHKARRGLLETGDVAERAVADLEARDAEAKKKKRLGAWTFCGVPGAACKRDADADAKKRLGAWTFCGVPGAACKRDVDSTNIENIVRSINEYDPSHFKRECYSAGGECAALVKAHKAFHAIKRESELLSSQPLSRRQAELDEDDDEEIHAFVDLAERGVIDSEVVKRSEEACHETDGDCTIAASSLYSIENALNEAINALDEE